MLKKILMVMLLLLPCNTAYSADFAELDNMYFWDTSGSAQYFPTWEEFKSRLGTELNLDDVQFNLNADESNLLWNDGVTYLEHLSIPQYTSDITNDSNYPESGAAKIFVLDDCATATGMVENDLCFEY